MNEFSFKRTWGPEKSYPNVIQYQPPNDDFVVIAGPCSVENAGMINKLAYWVSRFGATHLRGGVFRAGTYPGKNFGYIDTELIREYQKASHKYGLKNIIEVLDYTDESLDFISKFCDVFQVGCRSMQNYSLLKKLGKYGKPVFLKRHHGSTVDEWLGSAEWLLSNGVKEIHLIERGSATLHNDVRFTPCVHTIPSVASITKIPVIMDSAHGTGRRDLVEPLALAGIAAGAKGILCEVHSDPPNSLSDKEQAINELDFEKLMGKVKRLKSVL